MSNESPIQTPLLPCPFCGEEAMHFHTRVKSSSNPDVMLDYDYCSCIGCMASTVHFCDNKDLAIRAWNTRHNCSDTSLNTPPTEESKP